MGQSLFFCSGFICILYTCLYSCFLDVTTCFLVVVVTNKQSSQNTFRPRSIFGENCICLFSHLLFDFWLLQWLTCFFSNIMKYILDFAYFVKTKIEVFLHFSISIHRYHMILPSISTQKMMNVKVRGGFNFNSTHFNF